MHLDLAFLASAFVTLFVTIDPVGSAPLFPALTQGMSRHERRGVALRASLIGAGLLAFFALSGEAALEFVGISMPAFRIAGGLLLFLIAVDMLFEKRSERRAHTAGEEPPGDDPSVFPLAIPFLAGPGSITSIILLAGRTEGPAELAALIAVMLAVIAVAFVLFLASGLIEAMLGRTGVVVVTRILGMFVAALAVEFVLTGLRNVGALSG